MREEIIGLGSVGVRYGNTIALQDVDLSIFEGDFLGVIGPNGGGKSTLVKAIIGEVPYSGNITFRGKVAGRRNIGYLPQHNNIDRSFPISVFEVVMSGLQARKGFRLGYGKEDRQRVFEKLELAGITDIARRPIAEISGGQFQRTMLCRALVSEPSLLILDEPANFVDNKFENQLYSLLRQLNAKMSIIMVSHDLGTITSVVKSIVCVNRKVHRHDSNVITAEQLDNYNCPLQLVYHGDVPHTVLGKH